jgi:hypothetical protein
MNDHLKDLYTTQKNLIDRVKREIQGPYPGFIEAYDPKLKTCSVSIPITEYYLTDSGEKREAPWPKLEDIPVWFPGGLTCGITYPLKKATPVLLIPCARSISDWIKSDGKEPIAPDDFRAYPDGHFFCLGRLFPEKANEATANETDLIIENRDGQTEIHVCKSGEVKIKAKKIRLGSLDAGLALALGQATKNALDELKTHTNAVGTILGVPPVASLFNVESQTVHTNA